MEYFEFKATPTFAATESNDWVKLFKSKADEELQRTYERAYSYPTIPTTNIIPSNGSGICPWAGEFTKYNDTSNISKNYDNSNERAAENVAWINEYLYSNSESKDESSNNKEATVSVQPSAHQALHTEWIEEFQKESTNCNTLAEESAEMKQVALEILDSLNAQLDPKLENSRFVAYLRDLAGLPTVSVATGSGLAFANNLNECPINSNGEVTKAKFDEWKSQYLANIAPLTALDQTTTDSWGSMEKAWEKYEATGFGYRDFARKNYSIYQYSVPIEKNPYKDHSDSDLNCLITIGSLSERILAAEVLTTRDPNNQQGWRQLGYFQQANEIDPQAIAAFLTATRLDPNDLDAWVALAASCANESCIPDAYDAIGHVFAIKPNPNTSPNAQDMEQQAKDTMSLPRYTAAAILYNISGDHEKAATLLQSLTTAFKENWAIFNRIGASLANSQRYDEAIKIYDQLLSNGLDYPRVHYNKGIALMCTDQHCEAARSFITAIERQMSTPVDKMITNNQLSEELAPSYNAPLEALKVNFSLAGGLEETIIALDRNAQLEKIKEYFRVL